MGQLGLAWVWNLLHTVKSLIIPGMDRGCEIEPKKKKKNYK